MNFFIFNCRITVRCFRKLVKVIGSFAVPGAIARGISGYAAYAGMVLGITAAVDMIGISAVGGLATGHLSKH